MNTHSKLFRYFKKKKRKMMICQGKSDRRGNEALTRFLDLIDQSMFKELKLAL